MADKRFVVSGNAAEQVVIWLSWADKDYIAARRLLLNAYLPQGAGLANTALEKYFKTMLMLSGKRIPRSHDISAIHNSLCGLFGHLKDLNRAFLAVLAKAYALRYPDSLLPGFSVSLAQPKLVVELDRTVHRVRAGIGLRRDSGKAVETGMDLAIKRGEPDLTDLNCCFGNADRRAVFEALSKGYEMRILENGDILEAFYQVVACPDDSQFPLEGLLPGTEKVPDK
jgi:HEPN domain-containing protein